VLRVQLWMARQGWVTIQRIRLPRDESAVHPLGFLGTVRSFSGWVAPFENLCLIMWSLFPYFGHPICIW